MAHLIQMSPERERATSIAREMLGMNSSTAATWVRINRECPGLDRKAKRWILAETERERERISGAVHSPA